ncbi:MAG: YggS family pyridoxal phosphate-dependent enzyme [Deltaproteobacteria bacterium]|nr:MAG: YggS family pyridoxal phosphate-dependent enzyme [Deltaproteobacteria bacterium]
MSCESPESLEARIAANLAAVRTRIETAARRSGRNPAAIRLIAVTKTWPASYVLAALAAGVNEIGENYVQEIVEKRKALPPTVKWHMIGRLQRNKIKAIVENGCACIHTLESLSHAEEIDRRAAAAERIMPVLIEVNVGGERTKGGVRGVDELIELAIAVHRFPALDLQGLMAIPPPVPEPEAARPFFRELRRMGEKLAATLHLPHLELSMGMTNDFEIAIEEGATMVRIGTAIFGPRSPSRAKE